MDTKKVAKVSLATAAAAVATSHAANADPFEGLFFGVSANSNSGDLPFVIDGGTTGDYQLNPRTVAGAFVGLNTRVGGATVGAEISFQGTIDGDLNDNGSEPYQFNNMIDAKFRIGTVTQVAGRDTLIYGFAGISSGKMYAYYPDAYGNPSGTNAGIGIEMMVRDNVSVGAEWLQRGMWGYDEDETMGVRKNQTLSLRAAFHY